MYPLERSAFGAKNHGAASVCAEQLLEHPVVFVERFWQWRETLLLVAKRIMKDTKRANQAVEQCFLTACQHPPRFDSNGEFGSWLLRILIGEALSAQTSTHPAGCTAPRLQPADEFWCLETAL